MKEKKNLTEFMLSLVQTLEDEHRFGSAHFLMASISFIICSLWCRLWKTNIVLAPLMSIVVLSTLLPLIGISVKGEKS